MTDTASIEADLLALRTERDETDARLRAEIMAKKAELDVVRAEAALADAVALAEERQAAAQNLSLDPADLKD